MPPEKRLKELALEPLEIVVEKKLVGAPTAKSFPSALAEAFREAQVSYNQKQGGNPFKKVVGG